MEKIKKILTKHGYFRSCEEKLPVDKDGNALPLYSYPAIEYLKQLDFSQKSIFEFGSGQSTIFWNKLAASVKSVENKPEWADKLKDYDVALKENEREYVNYLLKQKEGFDVIIVDGLINRYECASAAITKLKPGGMIILDNSEWFFNSAELLRKNNLIQMDFSGFRPTKYTTSTTSLFLHRKFNFERLSKSFYPIGSVKRHSKHKDRTFYDE